ncbi:MAG: alpha/beta hydrolase [Bacteroidetes bacterium]|nr:alpha/beta hydrolase [Bacteroidota bacterium]
MTYKKQFFFVAAILFLVSCSKPETFVPTTLLSANDQLGRTSGELKTFIGQSGLHLSTDLLKYDVELYSITYKTNFQGKIITASGLVILPVTTSSVDMVCFSHGTIASHAQAPSALPLNSSELVLYTALASPGLIAVIPDFIGFGSSADVLHPYYVQDVTASSVIDCIKAARELAIQKKVSFNGKLFLAGYSQGGYVTMATHKAIEKNGLQNFDLIASFPSSGGYDVKGMQSYFFSLSTYAEPFFLAYVAMAYRNNYDWSQPLSDFFQSKYATTIPGLFDGTKNGDQINAALNDTIPKLVNTDLLSTINTNTKYQYIVDAFNKNSLLDWTPTKKMYMFHGDADITVPYQNSVNTYNKFISNGASTSVLTFTSFPGKTHGTGVFPYIEAFIPIMVSLK